MAAGGHTDKMVSDTVARIKQRHVTEFIHVEKMAPTDIHQCLLNAGDKTVEVNTVRQWVLCSTVTSKTNHLPDSHADFNRHGMHPCSQLAKMHS